MTTSGFWNFLGVVEALLDIDFPLGSSKYLFFSDFSCILLLNHHTNVYKVEALSITNMYLVLIFNEFSYIVRLIIKYLIHK